jgi:hypothetical protein
LSQNAAEVRLEELPDVKRDIISKLKSAGIETMFDLAIAIPHELSEHGGILTGAYSQFALDTVMKAKKAFIDSGLLPKDFSSAEEILERTTNSYCYRTNRKKKECAFTSLQFPLFAYVSLVVAKVLAICKWKLTNCCCKDLAFQQRARAVV